MKFGVALALALAPPELPSEANEASEASETDEAVELVLIHIAPDQPAIRARLQAELGLLGFVSERLELSEDDKVLGPDLLDRLDSAGADAAIEIALTPERINLWVADGTTGKTLHRRFDLLANPELGDPRTLAISAVELLRASRLELEPEPEPIPVAPVIVVDRELPPTESEIEIPKRPLRGAISVAPLITGSPGGFGPTAHLEVAGRWAPLERFGLRFSVWIPTVSNHVERPEGSARLLYGMAFVEPQLRLAGGTPWFHPELGLGFGVAVLGVTGKASPPYRGNWSSLTGFASHTHVGLGFAVTPRVWIRVDGYVGVVIPQPRITFSGTNDATWGLPWGTGSFGIELWF